MAIIFPDRMRQRSGTAIGIAAASAAGVGVCFLLRSAGGAAQVVKEYPQGGQTLAQQGTLYIATPNRSAGEIAQITALSATGGGSLRPLAAQSMPLTVDGPLYPGKDALYGVQVRSIRQQNGGGGVGSFGFPAGGEGQKKEIYLGSFALPSPPPAVSVSGESWKDFSVSTLEKGQATLWRIPYDGSAATRIVLDTKGARPSYWHLSPSENAFLWVRSGTGKERKITTKSGYYFAYPNDSELWRSPLDGGPAQLIASHISDGTWILGNRKIIAYQQRAPYPDATLTLHCRRIADGPQGKETLLRDYNGIEPPVEYQGRLYWIEPEPENAEENGKYDPGTIDPALQRRIVSESLESGDRRIVAPCRDEQGNPRSFDILRLSGDRLYALYTQRVQKSDKKETLKADERGFIACLHPDKGTALGTPLALPKGSGLHGCAFDEKNLYFPVNREERNWGTDMLDLVSANAVTGQITNALYRLPLPE